MSTKTRPTKKQHQALEFIKQFIADNGFSPSYREIMRGCNYTSVATVALHVNNLIKRGHIVKRNNSARSLEVVEGADKTSSNSANHDHVHELVNQIEERFKALEKQFEQTVLDEVYVLVGALKILGHAEPATVYSERISDFKQ